MSSEQAPFRSRRVIFAVFLTAVILSFGTSRDARAAGEPTVTIMMDPTTLTAGSVSTVSFVFSSTPIGFNDADVNLSNANGTLSPVLPTGDPLVYRATFTPNGGVNDLTNTIGVGVQWTDLLGVAPLAPSIGPNFSVNTAASASGGSPCPEPSVTMAAPNGGETLTAGSVVDVFWTAGGCQVVSLRLTLSTDGGENYDSPIVTSPAPLDGYYRWTVPDLDAGMARLRADLLGPGEVVLATDATDGTFVIRPSSAATASDAPPPSAGSTADAPPPEPAPGPAPAPSDGTPPPPPAEPVPEPTSTTPPPPPAENKFPGPLAPPTPNIPIPQATRTLASDAATQPTDASMNIESQNNPATDASTTTSSLDSARGAVETVSMFAPSSLDMTFSFVLGALSALLLTLGAQKVLRENRAKRVPRCKHCYGTGEEPSEKMGAGTCGDCDGAGTIEEEEEQSVECAHCEGEGEDPCHECKGTGKDASGNECAACRGGGKTLGDRDDQDAEPAECEVCRGEGEVCATIKKQVACETCGGTGRS